MADDSSSLFRRNIAWRCAKKNKPQSVCTGIHCQQGVIKIGYATDFNFDHMLGPGLGAGDQEGA